MEAPVRPDNGFQPVHEVSIAAPVEGGRVVTAAEVARGFAGAKERRVEELLATLAALGQAREVGEGRYAG